MLQILNKYFNKMVVILSFFVLVHSIISILFDKISILMNVLFIISIIQVPICVSLIVLLIINKRKNIVIEDINLVTLNHELNNYKDILRKIKYFDIHSVNYIYEFKGTGFTSIRTYKGKCISRKNNILSFPLVVAGDHNTSFKEIDCYVYDLIEDREKKQKRKPEVVIEGLYKFINYNFNAPLEFNQKFHIEVCYTWPNCVSAEKDYILASPIFFSKSFDRFNVELRFFDKKPIRIKKYVVDRYKKYIFRGELTIDSIQKNRGFSSFIDRDIEMKDNIAFYVYIYNFKE
jgi:hypothetical protein